MGDARRGFAMADAAMANDATPAPRGRRAGLRRLLVALAVLVVALGIVAPLFVDPLDTRAPAARAGVLDLGALGSLERPVALHGK